MLKMKWSILACAAVLALAAASCVPATTVPATATIVPSPIPATVTVVPPTVAPSQTPVPSPSAEPATATAEPASPTQPPLVALAPGQPITITTIHMLDANTGWALGGSESIGDRLLRTADGGQTWTEVSPPQPAPTTDQGLQVSPAVNFVDADNAWITYGSGLVAPTDTSVVWHTSDGGQNWTASQPISISLEGMAGFFAPSDLHFLDAQNGWFIAHLGAGMNHDYFTIFQTTDSGQTWTPLLDPTQAGPQSCSKTGLHFTSAQTGWLTGDCHGVAPGVFFMRTDDGGATWQDVALPAPAGQADLFTRDDAGCATDPLIFFGAQVAKLSVSCLILSGNPIQTLNFVYTTQDAGANWTSAPSPARSLTFLNPVVGWALPGGDGAGQPPFDLSFTQDTGKSWTKLNTLAWTGPLDFVDTTTGWAVARADQSIALVKTTDSGKTWQQLHPTIAP